MKNLLKVTMSLAMVLLLSVSAFAQETGTVKIEVIPGIEFVAGNQYDVVFLYDAYLSSGDDLDITNVLAVTANAPWQLDIVASTDGCAPVPACSAISLISVNGHGIGTAIPTLSPTNAMDQTITLDWLMQPDNNNIAAGTYHIADLTYTVSLK